MAASISVLVCTHNPRPAYLREVLAGLRGQSLTTSEWELLVIDNASRSPIACGLNLGWHPNGRVLEEPSLGKINALLGGIDKSSGELLVIVDDDNVLASDYLERAWSIAAQWPMLGTWGGSIEARYERAPPDWLKAYETYLSVRRVSVDQWFNLSHPSVYGFLPYGAGLCVRRPVADEYRRLLVHDPVRRQLGRKGTSLVSGEDTDLVLVGCDLGLGTGLFKDLQLTHLIHEGRLSEAYMGRMLEDMTYSLIVLAALRGHKSQRDSTPRKIWGYVSALRRGLRELRFHSAAMRGGRAAREEAWTWNALP